MTIKSQIGKVVKFVHFFPDNPTYSTNGRLISPGVVVPGTISMTNSELYFDADEDDPLYKQQDPKVFSFHWQFLHHCFLDHL